MNEGWICPLCRQVWSPMTARCDRHDDGLQESPVPLRPAPTTDTAGYTVNSLSQIWDTSDVNPLASSVLTRSEQTHVGQLMERRDELQEQVREEVRQAIWRHRKQRVLGA